MFEAENTKQTISARFSSLYNFKHILKTAGIVNKKKKRLINAAIQIEKEFGIKEQTVWIIA